MEREEVYARLNPVFQDIFDDDSISVDDNTTAKDIEEWDSLNHISLVVAVEKEFNFKFQMGEVIALHNVGDMVNIIAERGK
ncbi:MAG: acyl carrier protein [Rickettsiales bacterium]|nr:MAG: acyl carrier protein [Rickettsiales bacterium]